MQYLTIFDFATEDVDIYLTEFEYEPNMDELLKEFGHNANDCEWMFGTGNITFHKEVLK